MPRIDVPEASPKPRRRWWWRWLWRLAAAWVAVSVLAVLVLRFVDPPTTAFIVARRLQAFRADDAGFVVDQRWRPLSELGAALPIAVVASEDQRFPLHHGFDLGAIRDAWDERDKRVRGASTISQQVAKNLFLWSARSWLRKGLEVWFTTLIETTWPKRRILEVYLNVAEFGDGIYGAEAAARRGFGKPAARLTDYEAALLAGSLPNPRSSHAGRPSSYLRERARWIEQQVRQLGGAAYLEAPSEPAHTR
jgi:monofunctional biosynthetic peptidoglycan transglycosylase